MTETIPTHQTETMDLLAGVQSLSDLEGLAATRMPAQAWDYITGGSGDELTLAANRSALDRIGIVARMLPDEPTGPPVCELFGTAAAMPVAVAPMAYHRLAHPDGELASASAAAAADVPFTVSTLSSVSMEDVAALGGTMWFQLYWMRDHAVVVDLVRRAEACGARALVLTVDVPVMGRRLRDVRNGFTLPPDIVAANLDTGSGSVAHSRSDGFSAIAEQTRMTFEPALSWREVQWLRDNTSLPLIVKGLLDPDDADRAARIGVDGVVVSNHGGRQLDGAVASATVLPRVVDRVAGRCSVLLDSGIRGGTDVLRALASGADGVMLGRPVLWALAAAGQAGVARALELVRTELEDALRLAGCTDVAAARTLSVVPM